MAASVSVAGTVTADRVCCAGAPAPAPSGRTAARSAVTRLVIAWVGLWSSSEMTETTTGVTAAAGAVPPFQNCETMIAATADEMLAMASV